MFGSTPGDLLGRQAVEVADQDWGGAPLSRLLEEAAVQGEASCEFSRQVGVGEGPGLRCSARRLNVDGGASGVLLLLLEYVEPREDMDWRAAELSHRIKNSLQILSCFVASERRRPVRPEGYAAIQAQISAVGALYGVMAKAGGGDAVQLDVLFEDIAAGLRGSLLAHRPDIVIDVDAERLVLAPFQAEPVGLIVNELVTNAVKHAFPDRGGRIVLGARMGPGGEVAVWVADDGVGLLGAGRPGEGSRYIAAFARQLGADLASWTGPQGCRFELQLPASKRPAPVPVPAAASTAPMSWGAIAGMM